MVNFRRCLAILFIISSSTLARETPTVLALGDSITAGGKSFICYRQVLIPELRKKGIAFEFIGPNKDAASAHAGYGGKNTAQLLSILKSIYRKYPADILMLHSGHNSFSKDKPISKIVNDTEKIIENVKKINPNVTILLAQVILAGKLPKYSYIPKLNKELASLATRLSKQGYNIVLVNHAKGFNWKTDTISDKVHPNAAGAKKMADKWMDALLTLPHKNAANKSE
jgi:lysophospholipase L1-like esterase